MQEVVDITVDGYESVTVPAGTFSNALKLTRYTAYGTSTEWYADSVGFVKSVEPADLPFPSFIQELTSYTIK